MTAPNTPTDVTVRLPCGLCAATADRRSVAVAGRTIREIIGALDREFPGIDFRLCCETGELRPYVNIFLEAEDIRSLEGLDTPVAPGATVHILRSVAGG